MLITDLHKCALTFNAFETSTILGTMIKTWKFTVLSLKDPKTHTTWSFNQIPWALFFISHFPLYQVTGND